MPFDAPVELPVAVRVIDEMLDIFGSHGEHWLQGREADRKGNRCMIGALKLARRRIKARDDSTERLIISAIQQFRREVPPWFLEVQFSGGQWQRNPQAFTTQDEADRAGQVFLAQNQITADMNATFRELGIQISSPQYRITQE